MATKRDDGFNLAFLDVMACGLGAVLLILIVVKFNEDNASPSSEQERLVEEVSQLTSSEDALSREIKKISEDITSESKIISSLIKEQQALSREQAATIEAINEQTSAIEDLKTNISKIETVQANDMISLSGEGEENYILGLKVEGRHIGIMIDHSASMTHESLIQAIKSTLDTPTQKQSSPKWRRTLRVAKWLIARLPKDAKVSVIAFNDKAKILGGRNTHSANQSQSMASIAADLDKLIPENGTNLQTGLKKLSKAMPNMTDLYLITDGLPTLGEQSKSLLGFSKCKSFFGQSHTISGECRMRLFEHTVSSSAPSVKTNVILLPLEGDSQAPAAYWWWAGSTGGMMISPANNWP